MKLTGAIMTFAGPAHAPRPPSYNESRKKLLSPSDYSMHSVPSLHDFK